MGEVCAWGRNCVPPVHRTRNLFLHPPSAADFLAEVVEEFDDGRPWFNAVEEISAVYVSVISLGL